MNTAQRVENILRASRGARDSDTELLLIYMQKMGMNLTAAQMDKFRDMPTPETITRIRRKLQEQGMYPASEAVDKARYEKYVQVKGNIKSAPDEAFVHQGYKVLPFGE